MFFLVGKYGWMRIHECVYTVCVEGTCQESPTLFTEMGFLIDFGLAQLGYAHWPISSKDPLGSVPSEWLESQACATTPGYYVRSRDQL